MDWWKDIYSAMKEADVKQVAYVPDAGHAKLIDACIADNDMRAVPLTTESTAIWMSFHVASDCVTMKRATMTP